VLVRTDIPAILIESFFLDSIADMELFKKVGIDRLATAIVTGVLDS
jgi:N-acetylmuramoyl-L-alanine amidase